MSDTQKTHAETIADIIAEMRGMGNYQRYSGDHARALANRLEVAHRRERGDAAKLREAAVKCCEIALQWQADEAAGVAGTTDKPHARSAAEAVIDMEFELNAALSVPPRNCDEYANYKDAMNAFDAFVREQGKLGFINLYTESFKWLFAPTAEQEGESDGSK